MWQSRAGHMTLRHMRIACRLTKAKHTHSDCVILNVFPMQ